MIASFEWSLDILWLEIILGPTVTTGKEIFTISRDVNVSYFLGFPIFSMLVLTHLFLNLKCDLKKKVFSAS